jgi:acetyl esterase/lipase
MNLSEELKEPLSLLLDALGGGIDLLDIPAMRERLNRVCEVAAAPAPFAMHHLHRSPGPVVLYEYRPTQSSADSRIPALLWFHGGGYVMGKAIHDGALCQRFADDLGICVFSLDYPLAPEYPYPNALMAAECAWDWLLAAAASWCDVSRIAVGGASAGGGLAAGLALRLRDRSRELGGHSVQPCAQWLMYPMLDARTCVQTGAMDTFLWTGECNRHAWHALLAEREVHLRRLPPDRLAAMTTQPYFSPAQVNDLSGLPATFMAIGTIDLFHDENRSYAQRLREAGVPCEFHEFADAPHAFDAFAPLASASLTFEALRMAYLRKALFQGESK